MKNIFRIFAPILFFFFMVFVIGCSKQEEEQPTLTEKLLNPDPAELNQPSPSSFKVKFETSKGNFVIEVFRNWSPYGADRFYYLVKNGFYNNVRFFRVVEGFMAQFGYHGDPQVTAIWSEMTFPDDPVKGSNLRGYVTFAKGAAPNSRSTNIFINYGDNSYLDRIGFSPIGKVVEGMEVVDQLYSGYGDSSSSGGRGPEQSILRTEGNEYLNREFPNLDYIKKASIISQ